MRLVLHLGLPKSGTTAIQSRLYSVRRMLRREAHILYPDGAFNHNILAGMVLDMDRMPRLFRQKYGLDAAAFRADVNQFWSTVLRAVARHRPDTLLLSAESLCSPFGPEAVFLLRSLLRSIADTVDAISYVRRPSDYYLSSAQQLLRASHRVKSVQAIPYRAKLESIAAVADRMQVVVYDRSSFPSRDVVLDFVRRMIPEAEAIVGDAPTAANETLSAEIMAALQDYRRAFHAGNNNIHTPDTEAFVKALVAAEAAWGPTRRPTLHPHIRRTLDQGAPDLIWLRDAFGVSFSDIDYDCIGEPEVWRPKRVDEICPVDSERKHRLILRAMKQRLDGEPLEPKSFRTVRLRAGVAGGRLDALRQWIRPAMLGQ